MPWGAVVGAVVGAYGASQQAKAAKQSGQLGADAAAQSSQVQLQMYNQSRQDAEPWRQAGNWGLQQYMMLLGAPQSQINSLQTSAQQTQQPAWDPGRAYLEANPDVARSKWVNDPYGHYLRYGASEGRKWLDTNPNAPATSANGNTGIVPPGGAAPAQSQADITSLLRNQPGYQFAFSEGQRALESGAAANGGLFSGKAGKALVQYGQNVGDQNYGTVLSRYANLAGIGQTQNAQNAAYGQNYATNVGNNLATAANARASGLTSVASAYSQGAAAVGGAINYWGQQRNAWANSNSGW